MSWCRRTATSPRLGRITTQHGALLWIDEVQTGIGRTGAWFAHTAAGVVPDVVTLAKGLGGGMPIGACVGLGRAGKLLQPGNHGTTFGGNPVSAAAALAVLRTIEKEGLLGHVQALAGTLAEGLQHAHVREVRAQGLLVGIDLDSAKASAVARAALGQGFIINDCTPERIRLAPPLVVSEAEARTFLEAWPAILDEAYADDGDG